MVVKLPCLYGCPRTGRWKTGETRLLVYGEGGRGVLGMELSYRSTTLQANPGESQNKGGRRRGRSRTVLSVLLRRQLELTRKGKKRGSFKIALFLSLVGVLFLPVYIFIFV